MINYSKLNFHSIIICNIFKVSPLPFFVIKTLLEFFIKKIEFVSALRSRLPCIKPQQKIAHNKFMHKNLKIILIFQILFIKRNYISINHNCFKLF